MSKASAKARGGLPTKAIAPAEPDPTRAAEDAALVQRIESMPREVGWLLVYIGVLGVIVPGVPGIPFFIAAGAVLTPGGPKWMSSWLERNPTGVVRGGFKQMVGFFDNLDSRYPALPKTGN